MCHYVKLKKNNKFDALTIELVDEGSWGLFYGNSKKDKRIRYLLNTGKKYYFLDGEGGVVLGDTTIDDFNRTGIARFSRLNTLPCV